MIKKQFLFLKNSYTEQKVGVFFCSILCICFIFSSFFLSILELYKLSLIILLMLIGINDFEFFIIPNFLVLTLFFLSILNENFMVISLFLTFFISIFTYLMFAQKKLGGGDVKLIFVLGFVHRPISFLYMLFLAAILGILYYFFRKRILKSELKIIPFGFFLSLSSMIFILKGEELLLNILNIIS